MLSNRLRALAAVVATAIALTSVSFTPADARSRRGDAVAAAAILGIFGTIAALAARDQFRDPYYGPAPYYGGPVYGGPVYGGPRWGDWHGHHWYR